ncbi:MAG: hypothetical protein HY923_03440 [Elusimicrobia bacterium]|nr:hypothetical protein [Elusimicrobiota bacterium]
MKTLVRLLLVASLLYGTGAHWAALQSAAWAGMLATRVSESSWADAVKSTFSGEKPCRVCRVVAKGSSADENSTLIRPVPNVDFAFTVAPRTGLAITINSISVASPPFPSLLSFRPIAPPPKTVLPA